MEKVKIKGKGFDDFEIEFIEPLYEDRKVLTSLIHKVRTKKLTDENGYMYYCFDIVRAITGLSDKELNIYHDNQIIAISVEAVNYLAKKK